MPVSGYSRCQCLDILGASVCQGILRYNTRPLAFASSKCNNAITNNTVYAACRNKSLWSILNTMDGQELKLHVYPCIITELCIVYSLFFFLLLR